MVLRRALMSRARWNNPLFVPGFLFHPAGLQSQQRDDCTSVPIHRTDLNWGATRRPAAAPLSGSAPWCLHTSLTARKQTTPPATGKGNSSTL